MSTWIWSGRTALVWGTVAFLVLLLPAVVWQYRRFGEWNLKRLVGTAATCLYGTALVTYTWLPLPPRDPAWCDAHAMGLQLEPFRMVRDIAEATAGLPLLAALTDFSVLQVVFNVLLFVPLGVIVREFFHRSFLTTVAVGLGISLLIEATQATGLWGLYSCAYRLADVDDLITNTSGALLGALVAPLVLWWMPEEALLRTKRVDPRPVTSLRRWTGQAIDAACFVVLAGVLGVLARVLGLAFGWELGTWQAWLLEEVALLVTWVVVCVLPPWQHLAASPGQMAVWLTPMWTDAEGVRRHGSLARRLVRANLTALPVVAWLTFAAGSTATPPYARFWVVPALLSVLMVPFTLGHRSFSGWVTRAEYVDLRSLQDDPARERDFGGL